MQTSIGALALATGLALATTPAAAAPAPDQVLDGRYVRARVWLEDDRADYRRGDRLRIRFSASDDSYVAIVHIDPDGNLDFLYPSSPWDDGFVQRGRVYSPARTGASLGYAVRGRPGIGYLYMIASPVPLDYAYFDGGRGMGWDWSYAGRSVQGDPFWAMEQITRELLPDWRGVPYATDYTHYYVEGRHRYPSYACGNGFGRATGGWGWSDAYGSCDRHALFLRDNPYYYDTRLYRGDRRWAFRDYDYYDRRGTPAPRHGYKERVGVPSSSGSRLPVRSQGIRDDEGSRRSTVGVPRSGSASERPAEPARRRPSLERRGSGSDSHAAPRAQPTRSGSRGTATGGTVRPQSPPSTSKPRSRRPAGGGASGG